MSQTHRTVDKIKFKKSRLDDSNICYLSGFHCGNEGIDHYVTNKAFECQKVGQGVTYLIIDEDANCSVAYYTIVAGAMYISENEEPLSSIAIKMFAVSLDYQDVFYQDAPIATLILNSAISEFYDLSAEFLGFEYIILFSVEDAVNFYEKSGFVAMTDYVVPHSDYKDGCTPMYFSMF